MEAAMGFLNLGHIFKPLELEILDRVYEAAWAHIEARDLYRDPQKAGAREDALRRWCSPLQALVRSILTLFATRCSQA